MKWPSIDESVSLCICLLTVACNCEMQHFFFIGYSLWGGGDILSSGSKLNCAAQVGSGQTISGTGRVRASVLSPCRPLDVR